MSPGPSLVKPILDLKETLALLDKYLGPVKR
jgi:hypothetical protein